MEQRTLEPELPTQGVLAPSDLARREDLHVGGATIRPALKTVAGPLGSASLEPRVMQVLIVLADAGGAVRTREDLLRSCWPGVVVGEDAVNRTIAEIRRVARKVGAGFTIETIPRIGYRFVAAEPAPAASPVPAEPETGGNQNGLASRSRRWLVGGVLAAATALAGTGLWRRARSLPDPRFEELVAEGQEQIFLELPDSNRQGIEPLREAVLLQDDNAAAWGLLALAYSNADALGAPNAASLGTKAAARALQIDTEEPNARVAMAMLNSNRFNGFETHRRLVAVAQAFPDNPAALDNLTFLLQSAGDMDGSLYYNEAAISADAKANRTRIGPGYRKALKLWIRDQPAQAEDFGAQVLRRWNHPYAWNALLLIRAFTDRFAAASQLLDHDMARRTLTPEGTDMWRLSLHAMDTGHRDDQERALRAIDAAAGQSLMQSVHGALLLADFQRVPEALLVIRGILLREGQRLAPPPPSTVAQASGDAPLARDPGWLNAHWLFSPPMKAVHDDPQWAQLKRDLGLQKYWDERHDWEQKGLPL